MDNFRNFIFDNLEEQLLQENDEVQVVQDQNNSS